MTLPGTRETKETAATVFGGGGEGLTPSWMAAHQSVVLALQKKTSPSFSGCQWWWWCTVMLSATTKVSRVAAAAAADSP